MNHHLFKEDEFEEEQSEEEIEEDSYEGEEDFDNEEFEEIEESEESEKEFEEEESEEYTEEEFDEKSEDEFEDEFDEKSEEEFNEESENKFDERSEEDFDEESEEHTEEESEDQLEDEFDETFEEEIDEKSENDFDEKSEDQSEEECEENSKEQSEEEDFEDEFKEESKEEGQELKMALVNARSILKFINRGDRTLIDLIQDNDLDVLLITETWLPTENLTNADFRTILPPKYNIIDEPRFYGRGGGVAIIYHRNLICKKVQFAFPSAFEFVAAAVRQPGSKDTVLILSIYRPPGGSITEFSNNFLSELHLLLCDVYARYENVIIGGDFNI